MRRWLICPGMPRSGTTFLFEQLTAAANRAHFNVPRVKEVHWLERGWRSAIEDLYPGASEEAIYLDLSPGYSGHPNRFWNNLRGVPRDGSVKFIVTLRDPVEQAFAHYLHDIVSHLSVDWSGDLRYPFFGKQQMMRYFVDRSSVFEDLADDFGDNVLFLNFHTMFRDLDQTADRIARLVGVEKLALPPGRVGEGGWLPRFVYGGAEGVNCVHDDRFLAVPARALLLINGPGSRLQRDVPEELAQRLMVQSMTWQEELSEYVTAAIATAVFDRTIDGFSDLLGEDIGSYRAPVLRAKTPPIAQWLDSEVAPAASLGERLRWGRWLGTLDK